MKLKDARRLMRKIMRLQYEFDETPENKKDREEFIDALVETDYRQYKKLGKKEKLEYDAMMKQNFDIMSTNKV